MNLQSTRSLPRTMPLPAKAMPAGASERSRRFAEAMRLLEEGCWQTAFMSLAELADDGHPQAARVALVFARRGTSLFGGTFHATAQQRDRWEQALA